MKEIKMGEIRCGNCKFFKKYDSEDNRGECRKHSPVITNQGLSRWPVVVDSEWCGEFEKRKGENSNNET